MGLQKSPEPQHYRIRSFECGDEARWDAFVAAAPEGTFYHLSGWKQIFEEVLGHRTWYLYCDYQGEVTGVLPLVQVKSLLFGNALMSVPFLVYGGPLAANAAAAHALTTRAVELGRDLKVDYIELRHRSAPIGAAQDADWVISQAYATFRKGISSDPDENFRAIPRKQRAMIRKAFKLDLCAEEDEDVSRLYAALLECKRNLGTPFFGKGYLQAIKEVFKDRAEILTVTKDKRLICSVMSFRFRDEILPYYGGGGNIARNFYGNDFMYWSVMKKACTDGVRVFDYGRSRAGTGAYRFKKHWGFEPAPMHYRYFLVNASKKPELNPSNPKFTLLINAWKRLPLSLAARFGPPLARRLG